MAKKIKEVKSENNTIENLPDFVKEWNSARNPMLPRKALMLKLRLIELWENNKNVSEAELDLLESMLTRERKLGKIADTKEEQILNQIEKAVCTETCTCTTTDSMHPMWRFVEGESYSFMRVDQDNQEKFQAGSEYKYVVYVDYVIPPEHQLTREIIMKEERGHHADESMYPKNKPMIRRQELDDRMFERYFTIDEDLLTKKDEESYTF